MIGFRSVLWRVEAVWKMVKLRAECGLETGFLQSLSAENRSIQAICQDDFSKIVSYPLAEKRSRTALGRLSNSTHKIYKIPFQLFLPFVNAEGGMLFSYQNRSPFFKIWNCCPKRQPIVGPTTAPVKGRSANPPTNKSMSSTCWNEFIGMIFSEWSYKGESWQSSLFRNVTSECQSARFNWCPYKWGLQPANLACTCTFYNHYWTHLRQIICTVVFKYVCDCVRCSRMPFDRCETDFSIWTKCIFGRFKQDGLGFSHQKYFNDRSIVAGSFDKNKTPGVVYFWKIRHSSWISCSFDPCNESDWNANWSKPLVWSKARHGPSLGIMLNYRCHAARISNQVFAYLSATFGVVVL